MSENASPPRRLFLHVGLPKTGSTFLQAVLAGNRDRLRAHGYLYPFVRREAMFHGAVELRDQYDVWGLDPVEVAGTWDRLVARAVEVGAATTVISHELLGAAEPAQIAAAVEPLGSFELHVVVTARDLARQVPAHWQEQVKNGRTYSFAEFEPEVADPALGTRPDSFWREQDLGDVLDRWGAVVPPERLHVVVCPRSGAEPTELWRRFATAIGLSPEAVDLSVVETANSSLSTPSVALLRQVNGVLGGRLGRPAYVQVVKRFFAQRVLAQQPSPDAPRAQAPQRLRPQLTAVTESWMTTVRERNHPTYGPLEELLPTSFDDRSPDDVSTAAQLALAPEVVAELLLEIAELRGFAGEAGTQARPDGPATTPPERRGWHRLHRRK